MEATAVERRRSAARPGEPSRRSRSLRVRRRDRRGRRGDPHRRERGRHRGARAASRQRPAGDDDGHARRRRGGPHRGLRRRGRSGVRSLSILAVDRGRSGTRLERHRAAPSRGPRARRSPALARGRAPPPRETSFDAALAAFADAVAHGGGWPGADLDDGARSLTVIAAAERASTEHETVAVAVAAVGA